MAGGFRMARSERLFRVDDHHHGEPQHAGDGEAQNDPDVTADQHGAHAIHQPGGREIHQFMEIVIGNIIHT